MKRKLSFKKLNMLLLASVLATGTVGMTTGQIVSAQENETEKSTSPEVISTSYGVIENYDLSPYYKHLVINFSEPINTELYLDGTVEVLDANGRPVQPSETLNEEFYWLNNNQTLSVYLVPLDSSQTYTINVSGFYTMDGELVPDYTSELSYIGDNAKPSVTSVTSSVPENEIIVNFDSPMLVTSPGTFKISSNGSVVPSTYTWADNQTLVVTPSVPLEYSTSYNLVVNGFYASSCELMNNYSTTIITSAN